VVAFLFEDDPLLTGYLSRLNEKLAGSLAPLADNDFLTGKRNEVLLIASQERIKADKLIFAGLGPVSKYSSRSLGPIVRKVSSILERLKLHEFGIMVPWVEEGKIDYVKLMKSVVRNLVEYYSVSKRDAADLSLKVIFSIEEQFLADLQSLGQELRIILDSITDYSIVVDNSKGQGNEKI